jgi:Zn-dependent M28 family amino/carboxypeptidase
MEERRIVVTASHHAPRAREVRSGAGRRLGRAPAALAAAIPLALASPPALAQETRVPPAADPRIHEIVAEASPERIERDIRTLVGFGTRNTLSDTLSETRGIGAARRWIKAELDRISADCGGCLEVSYQRSLVEGDPDGRIRVDTWVVNVVAILRGETEPGRYVIMSGDIDSRASDASDGETDAPGANDNASGMAGVLEAARLLTASRPFSASVVFVGLSGEEQGLWGGEHMAQVALDEGWDITAVLNNDMIGNVRGVDGVVDNTTFRVFSEATPVTEHLPPGWSYRTYGGEVDSPSRQLARYVDRITDEHFTNLDALLIYRLDRFGRGGHHRPFNDAGFAGVRIMETHENYVMQHQDVRVEDGVAYGDVIEGVDFEYAARLTAVNAAVLASLAWAPPAPRNVRIGGAVQPSTTLAWDAVDHPDLVGYRVYWRDTTAPQWQRSRFVGRVDRFTLEGMVVDNYLFGVAAVARSGDESVVSFPTGLLRRGG